VWPLTRSLRAAVVPGLLLAALAGWALVSASWSASSEDAVAEFARTALYLGVYVLVVLTSRRDRLGRWLDGLAIAIAATGLVALTSRLFPGSLPARGLPAILPSASTRLSFPVDYWNGLGILVGIAFPLLVYSALAGGRGRRMTSVGVLPALGAVLYLTSSRGSVAATAVGTLVLVVAHPRWLGALGAAAAGAVGASAAAGMLATRHAVVDGPLSSSAARTEGRQAAVALVAICIATAIVYEVLVGAASRLGPPNRRARRTLVAVLAVVGVVGVALEARSFRDFTHLPPTASGSVGQHLLSGSGSGRWQFWSAAVAEFRRFPVHGGGAGSFESWWARHGSFAYFVRDAHSLFVQTLAELGIIGLLLLVAMLVVALVTGVRRWRNAGAADQGAIAALLGAFTVYLLGAAIDWMWELTIVTVVGIAVLGLLTGPATAPVDASPTGPGPPWRRRSLVLGLVVTAFALTAAELVVLLADVEVGRSQADARAGRFGAARADAVAASKIEPWAGTPYLQLALVEESRGNLGAARRAAGRSITRDSADWRPWFVLSRIDTGLGRYASAAAALTRARSLDPRSPLLAPAPGS
jgi:O-antigen ligase